MTDFYVALHITTTLDENPAYVTHETSEVIEIAWNLISSSSLEVLYKDSVLIRPANSPIPASSGLSWDALATAPGFKEGISKIDQFIHEHIISKGLDFVFVTFDGWNLRVALPREARDKSVVLPPYLQHSKSFSLKNEYLKWQVHHPETLSYSATNLGNILTALEVELAPPLTYANISSVPKRASEEVEILTKILTQLIKKSKPAEEHPDVLTRPFDSKTDIRCFLSERSKVLHLSNLPHDTTQSELESWFTSYGARPIAFWTLKTPDQHKPTGSGFVVFSTHEEAAESLGMNGRCLNDKPIEVQPSSARILDRAQEILTAFPQSKNRPRPGDWTCPSCGFSNFQRRTACFRCSFPAATAVAIQEQAQNFSGNNNNNNNGNQNQNQNQNHHGHNHNNQNQQQIHHNQNQSNNNNMNGNGNGNQNKKHNNHNNHNNNGNQNNQNQNQNRSVPFRAGDWKCLNETCQYHNFAKNISCLRCGAPRSIDFPAAVISQQQQQQQQQGSVSGTATPTPQPQHVPQHQQPQQQIPFNAPQPQVPQQGFPGFEASADQQHLRMQF